MIYDPVDVRISASNNVRSDRGLWTSGTLSLTSATVAIGRLRIIFPYASYNSALKEAGIPSLYDRRASLSSDLFNDIVLDINHKLAGLLPPKAEHHRQLRSNRKFYVPVCKTDRFKKSFIVSHSLRM